MIQRGGWFAVCLLLYGINLYGQNAVTDSLRRSIPDSLVNLADSTAAAVIAKNDSLREKAASGKPRFYPKPKKALRLSLLTPGLAGGQLYNRDYWKLPFVYAGYGVSIYFVVLNINRYGTMVDHYKEFYHLDDPSDPLYGQLNADIKTVSVFVKSRNQYVDMNINQVSRAKDTYRRWRDWSFFALGAVYALAAIEANVAAHLKTFDLSDDLSLRVQPSLVQPRVPGPAPGVRLVLLMR